MPRSYVREEGSTEKTRCLDGGWRQTKGREEADIRIDNAAAADKDIGDVMISCID